MVVIYYKLTYSYKKVDHKKYIECEIDLLCNVIAKMCAHLNIFVRCINEVNNKGCNAKNKNKHHL